jgi:hypothetical protein
MHSLGGANSVVSNSNMNMEDDMDNGTEKVHIKNHDQCDSCGDGGGLLCCDNCPRSFHFDCINPPIRPEAVEQMQGNWYCNDCKSKLVNLITCQTPLRANTMNSFQSHHSLLLEQSWASLSINWMQQTHKHINCQQKLKTVPD